MARTWQWRRCRGETSAALTIDVVFLVTLGTSGLDSCCLQMLRMEQASTEEDAQYEAMGKWADSLSSLAKAVVHKLV